LIRRTARPVLGRPLVCESWARLVRRCSPMSVTSDAGLTLCPCWSRSSGTAAVAASCHGQQISTPPLLRSSTASSLQDAAALHQRPTCCTILVMWVSEVLGWAKSLDYGSVPGWVGVGSLLLAIKVFLRDRAAAQRSQVEQVGVWVDLQWERRVPDEPLVLEGSMEWSVRNGNALPIDIVQIVYDVNTLWWVRDEEQWSDALPVWRPAPGTEPITFVPGKLRVPPMETFKSGRQPFHLGGRQPEEAVQLDLIGGLSYEIHWVLIADSRGGRWIQRPGRRPQHLRWFSRRPRTLPKEWQGHVVWGLRRFPHWIREERQRRRAERSTNREVISADLKDTNKSTGAP
jgi:hypothetical protein